MATLILDVRLLFADQLAEILKYDEQAARVVLREQREAVQFSVLKAHAGTN